MLRINADDQNTREHWDTVYQQEQNTDKQRVDDERLNFIASAIRRYFQSNNQTFPKFVDLGCGDGEAMRWLHYKFPAMKQTGVDISPFAISELEKNSPQFKGIVIDFNKGISLPAGSFDMIWCGETLEHTQDPNTTISQIMNTLRDGGYFVFSIPIKGNNPSPEHNFMFEAWDVMKIAGQYGTLLDFDVVARGLSMAAIIMKGVPNE